MGRRSIMLLLAFAVLLQPALASVCMMQCPPQVAAQPMASHAPHSHHHGMTAACSPSPAISANGICDKTVDLRSSALVAPIVNPAVTTSETDVLGAPSQAVSSPSRLSDRADRFHAPIVVPLRI